MARSNYSFYTNNIYIYFSHLILTKTNNYDIIVNTKRKEDNKTWWRDW